MCAKSYSWVWLYDCHPPPLRPRRPCPLAPLSMGFSRQEYWRELPFPPPGALLNAMIKPASPALAGIFFTTLPPGKLQYTMHFILKKIIHIVLKWASQCWPQTTWFLHLSRSRMLGFSTSPRIFCYGGTEVSSWAELLGHISILTISLFYIIFCVM